ncbi:hypothetical protein D9756_008354 [Leucocoprinus leucothites]|uniref:Hydrophobin n=1 Tax=Leucocoprinus leucothites TaxID=201217 RepID=A0A8H5FVA3_9AGAR|nr:hypothetical protein D9756_008354 [Leucoagaricus leucothites]
MFSKIALFVTSAFVLAAVAAPGGPIGGSSCNAGPVQCCNTVQSAKDSSGPLQALLGLIGVNLADTTANIGVTCTPLSVIGVSGNGCSAQSVCCENNSFKGVVALGCTPVNVIL